MPAKKAPSAPASSYPVYNRQTQYLPRPAAQQRRGGLWWVLLPFLALAVVAGGILAGSLTFVYARDRIIPGVTSLGVPLGTKSTADAAAALWTAWDAQQIALRSDAESWVVRPSELGLVLDAAATAEAAASKGRAGSDLVAVVREGPSWFDVAPVWSLDPAAAEATLTDLASRLAVAPVDAQVRIAGGRAEAVPAEAGRELDMAATLSALQADPARVLESGQLALATRPVPAAVEDATSAVDEANRLLATTVTLRAYDPVRDETLTWPVGPAIWSEWLRLTVDPAEPRSFRWVADDHLGAAFLDDLEAGLDGRTFDDASTLAAVSQAIQSQQPDVQVRLYHPETRHVVRSGETLSSIGYAYGIPYPWIQQANPGVDALSVGQTIIIPSPDVMLPLEPVAGKRIIVSMSEQRARVYENGALKWDWPASTGIDSSPTAPGVFQVQSHEPNAYAGNWDLWMPSFLGIYRPVPTSDFMNGFHGFPTRGNAQLLWTGDLGRRVTYGCILLSSENAQLLYDWAEDGVIVEVRP